ncbi:MAG: cysteine peptidase family C39 domain-containing protein [Bacteroidota bacterium]
MISYFPFFRQLGELDCGVACLKMIFQYFGKSVPLRFLYHKIPLRTEGVSLKDISDTAECVGLKTMGVKVTFDRLEKDLPTPCIAYWKQEHFIVIYQVTQQYVWVADPATRGVYVHSKASFTKGWICDFDRDAGILLLFEPTKDFYKFEMSDTLVVTH